MAPGRSSPPAPDDAVVVPHDLDDLLWRVTAYVHLMQETALADTPLTVSSSTLLTIVFEEPGLSVAEISRRIPKAQQTLSQLVGRLEKLGLLERRLRSGRGIGLYVTDAGREMVQVAVARQRDVIARLRDLLGEQRSDALTALLSESLTLLQDAR